MVEKKARIKRDYDKSASSYDNRYAEIQYEKFKILNGLELKGRILDLGGGTGLLGRYLRRKDIVNVDISLGMLKLSDEINICADLDNLPLKSNCFGTVLSFTVLQNLPRFDHIFNEVRRVLKPHSMFVCSVLNKVDSDELVKQAELASFKVEKKGVCGEDIWFVFTLA